MDSVEPQTPHAKQSVMQLFQDSYGREKMKPYYVTQIKTILEEEFSDDVVYHAIEQLVEEQKLSKFTKDTKYAGKVVFVYNKELDKIEPNRTLKTHIKSNCKLIAKYSKPAVARRYADHLEELVKKELEKQGFKIVGTHTNKYEDKKYEKSKDNLDFIAKHRSRKLTVGVEVKNTLSILDKKEVDIKMDICDYLGITPVFAVRYIEPYVKLIENRGGFSWIFKTQVYPPSLYTLSKTISKRLQLPVDARTDLPPESVELFHIWVKNQTT